MSQKDPLLGSDWSASGERDASTVTTIENHMNGMNGMNSINKSHLNDGNNHYNNSNNSYLMNYASNHTTQTYNANNSLSSTATANTTKQLMSAIGMSSSSDSSTDDIVIPMQRRKVKTRFARKRRSRSTDSSQSIKSRALTSCPSICMKIVLIVLIVSSLAFTVLFISKLYDRIDSLQTAINDLSNSGNGVPPELHSIHSHLKTLDGNISAIKVDVIRAFDSIDNLTQEVKQMKLQMSQIADSVEAAPAIRQLPKELQDLQKVVAEMGSRLTTNDNDIKTMKDKQNSQQSRSDSIQTDLGAIHANITELYANVEHNNSSVGFVAKLEHNSNQLNQLSDNINNLQMFYKDLINWKTEADEKIRTVMQLTQHIHDKLHNNSLEVHNNGAKHGSHNSGDESMEMVTTGGSVPVLNDTLS